MPGNQFSIVLKNDLSELERLSDLVNEFGERHQISPDAVYAVNLALDEILTNVISYGYDDKAEHRIEVRITITSGEIIAEVEDDGRPFNPLELPEVDVNVPLEERPVGGLGIYLTRKLMDSIEYRREGGRNILLMKKKIQMAE